ncbi:MAG: glycosyltransferase family 39 protein [Deltaproteobacteria bacterium]|jgi:tetratricopeptide (TPR) repeat protein|nr:glycosyltransferase family 39 protein [Deltaproteobacteria bacterium]
MHTAAEQSARPSSAASTACGIPAAVWGIAGIAVALRAIHAWLMLGDPLYEHPAIDPAQSLERAKYLAEISWLGPPEAYWKPPLYDYFLGVHYALFGESLWPARVSQILLDGGSCILIFALARRLISRRAGIAAAAVIGLWGPLIYFSSVHVSTSLTVFLELCVLLLALRARGEPSNVRWMDAGLALGLLAAARAETLLLAPWLAGWLWLSLRQHARRERVGWVAMLALGVIVVVGPIGLRNALYARDPVLISANGGINFLVGSDPKYRGVIGVRPGPEWELLTRAPIDLGYYTESERSQFHFRRARALIASDPGRWALQLARKFGHVWHGRELASNRDLYTVRGESFVLAALLWRSPVLFFPFGVLAPLALVGMAISWRQRCESRFLIGLVAVHCGAMMLFFVTGRFRLAMLPVLVLFAIEAVSWAIDCVREKRSRALAVAAGCVVLLFALTNFESVLRADPDAYEPKLRAEEHYFRGTVLGNDMGRPEEGKAELHKALELEPDFVAIAYNLAQLYEKSGDDVAAMRLFRRSLEVTERSPAERYVEPAVRDYLSEIAGRLRADPAQPEPIRRFAQGIGCMDRRDWECAIADFRAAMAFGDRKELAPLLGLAHLERGREQLRAERNAAALSDLSEASRLRPHDAVVYVELGVALTRAKRFGKARSAFGQFRIYDLPRGDYYRRAIDSADEGDRAVALAAARAVSQYFPRDRLARETIEVLSR